MKRQVLLSFVFLLVMIIVMRWQGKSLVTPVSPYGILDLEFARTGERMQQLRLFWNAKDVFFNVYMDFLFIASYTWFFISACQFIKKISNWKLWSNRFISIAIATACFDVAENFMMLLVYNGRFNPFVLQIVYVVAIIKFVLAAALILYILTALPFVMLQKNKRIRV